MDVVYTRPEPGVLLGALLRHAPSRTVAVVREIHMAPGERVVLVCRTLADEDFEILLFIQEIFPGIAQLVLEMPWSDWEWFDFGERCDRDDRAYVWRKLPNEDDSA